VTGSFTDPGGAADLPYDYAWTAINSDGVVVGSQTGQITSYPASGPVSVPSFTFTPANEGNYTVTLQVTDVLGGSGSDQRTLAVRDVTPPNNVPPTVKVIAPANAREGSPLTVTGSFTDPGGAADLPYKYTWTAINSNGVVIGSRTGQITSYPASGPASVPSFTFTPANEGNYTVTLQVTDVLGGSGRDQRAFAVRNFTPPPSSPPPASPPTPPAPPRLQTPPLLAFFDSILGGVETVNSNGTETVIDTLFGIPLFISTYDGKGILMSVTLFGIDITWLFRLFP
jgi:hypothetical protein